MKNNLFEKYGLIIFIVIIFIITIYIFYPSIVYNKVPGNVDNLLYSNWRFVIQKAFENGEFPLWNPLKSGGLPLAPEYNPGLFYPTTFLLYFFDFLTVANIILIFHFVLMPFAFYLLLRCLERSVFASIIGSFFYCFSGYVLVRYWVGQSCFIICFTHAPLAILYYIKSMKTEKLIYTWFAAFFLALQFFGGRPEIVIYTHVLLIIFTFYYLKKERIWFIIKNYAILNILFFLAAYIQFAPLYEFLDYTIRGDSYQYSAFVSFPFKNLITFIFPSFFGEHHELTFWGVQNFFEQYCYVGILPLIVFPFAFFNKEKKIIYFLLATIILGFLISFGKYTPFHLIISKIIIPISKLRVPSRAMYLPLFSFSILTAIALDNIKKNNIIKKYFVLIFVFGLIVLAGYLFADFTQSILLQIFPRINKIHLIQEKLVTTTNGLLHPAIMLIIYPLILYNLKEKRTMILFVLLLLVVYETIIFNKRFIYYFDMPFNYSEDYVIKKLSTDKSMFRLMSNENVLDQCKYHYHSINTVLSFSPTFLNHVTKFLATGIDSDVNYIRKCNSGWWGYNNISNLNSKLLDLFNAKYIYHEDKLYENKNCLPRFFFVGKYNIKKDLNETLTYMNSEAFNPKDEIVILKNPNVQSIFSAAANKALIQGYGNNYARFKLETNTSSFFLFLDVWL